MLVEKLLMAFEHPLLHTVLHFPSPFIWKDNLFKTNDLATGFDSSIRPFVEKVSSISNNWCYRFTYFCCSKFLHCDEGTLALVHKCSRYLNGVFNYIYLVLCVHVVSLTVSPHFQKIVLLKNYSKTLDDLSSLSPNSEIDFKRNISLAKSKRSAELDGEPVTINVEQPEKSAIQTVHVAESISNSNCPLPGYVGSVAAKNFETFLMTPFTLQPQNATITLRPHKSTSISKAPPAVPNSTTIVDKDLVNITTSQPFWTLLAATKAIIKRPEFFAGKVTKKKNNGVQFLSKPEITQEIPMAVRYIDGESIILKILQNKDEHFPEPARLQVKVNNIFWMRTSIYYGEENTYICIFGLSPLSQYEIEIFDVSEKPHKRLNQVVCSTISLESRAVLNLSQDTSPFETLQSSLISSINGLAQLKADYKKLKRDEHKRISDLRKESEFLKSRISKYNQNLLDSKSNGKVKGLQNTVSQFENEVRELNERLSVSNTSQGKTETEFKAEEREYQKRIAEINDVLEGHEESLTQLRNNLKAVLAEVQQLRAKKHKLSNKVAARMDEVQKVINEIKVMKKSAVLGRLQKRHKKLDEKYEGIMSKIAEASQELQAELQRIQQ